MTDQMETLGTPEPKRDRWGRYLVTPPDGGKAVAMTRATTVAKAIDDTEGLQKWMKRQVAFGMGQRPDLVAAAATTEPTDKKRLAGIAEDAMDAAGSSAAATVGTALHRATELADLGLEVPEMFAERVDEYRRTLTAAGITVDPDLVEAVLVLWQHQIAGTTDRIVGLGGRQYVFDLKTGESVYPHSFALQLAIYAMADNVYDLRTETLRPMPEVDQDRAIICHLPAKGGPCTLHWIDISAGREALEHALWVRSWRRRRDLLLPFDVPEVTNDEQVPVFVRTATGEPVPVEGDEAEALRAKAAQAKDDRRARLVDALRPLKDADKDAFVARWRRDLASVPFPNRADEWTQLQMDAVEMAFELPFSDDVQPVVAPVLQMPEPRPEEPAEDHGGMVDTETLSGLRARINKAPRGVKGWMLAWEDDAKGAGLSWRMGRGNHVSKRSYMTSLAGLWLAKLCHESGADDPQDDARLVLASVLGDAALMPTISVGQCLAALTLDEASLCQSIAQAAVEGEVRMTDAGLLEVAA